MPIEDFHDVILFARKSLTLFGLIQSTGYRINRQGTDIIQHYGLEK